MICTVIGRVADNLGHGHRISAEQGRLGPELRHHYYARPATEYRSRQPQRIPLDVRHGHASVGYVQHLSRDEHSGLWAVCVLDRPQDRPEECVYFSPATTADRNGGDIEMTRLALTDDPASINPMVVTIYPGNLAEVCRRSRALDFKHREHRELLERASNGHGPSLIWERQHPIEYRGGFYLRDGEPIDVERRQDSGRSMAVNVNGRYRSIPIEYSAHSARILRVR